MQPFIQQDLNTMVGLVTQMRAKEVQLKMSKNANWGVQCVQRKAVEHKHAQDKVYKLHEAMCAKYDAELIMKELSKHCLAGMLHADTVIRKFRENQSKEWEMATNWTKVCKFVAEWTKRKDCDANGIEINSWLRFNHLFPEFTRGLKMCTDYFKLRNDKRFVDLVEDRICQTDYTPNELWWEVRFWMNS